MKAKKKKIEMQYYSLNNILKHKCEYYIIVGERSNGKTYALLKYALENFRDTGKQTAYIRRVDVEIKKHLIQGLFDNLIANGEFKKIFKDKYNQVVYRAGRFYLAKSVENEEGKEEIITCETPLMYVFSINNSDKYRSQPYPNINTIFFEEFMSHEVPLPNEFILFQGLLSTIIRLRDDVKIFMVSNTVNPYSLYFDEMGINMSKLHKGSIDVIEYDGGRLKVAIEFSDFNSKDKASNKYFAFDNPKLKMITQGTWEIGFYPHLPYEYRPCEVKYKFYLEYKDVLLQGNIIELEKTKDMFIYFHKKTSDIKEDNKNLVYSLEANAKTNYRKSLNRGFSYLENIILKLFDMEKVFYHDNNIGNIVENYLKECDL